MNILVLFGGESVEHEISIITASQVMNALSVNYTVIPLYISKENKFYYSRDFLNLETFKNINKYLNKKYEVKIIKKDKCNYLKLNGLRKSVYFDMAFPVVHGKGMEDGTLLSYLQFKKIPTIANSLSFYALAQNKALTKRVLNDLKIKNTYFIELANKEEIKLLKGMKFPVIVKPNTLGSSIGIKKVNNEDELQRAVDEAFSYDSKVIVEQFLNSSKEYNISVTNKGGKIITSHIEEVVKVDDILDYKQKYEGKEVSKGIANTKRIFPAKIEKDVKKKMEEIAKNIYKRFEAKGVIRIDFLFWENELYVNEINSIPGSYAFYLWKGKMDFVELLDCVIDNSKRELFIENKLIKYIDKMNIFEQYKGSNKLK